MNVNHVIVFVYFFVFCFIHKPEGFLLSEFLSTLPRYSDTVDFMGLASISSALDLRTFLPLIYPQEREKENPEHFICVLLRIV